MTTQLSSNNIQPATLATLSPVTITSITVTDSSWTPLDDSAVSTSGGYIVITGTNFATGCNVIIGSINATSVAFVNSTTLRVQVPALSAGTYVVYVTNTNGTTAIIVNGLTYSGTPTWVTASPLPQGTTNIAISIQLSATGDTPLTYALQAGSSLPASLTLSSSGLLSGTVSGLTSETTYNFTIEAIDPQLQDSPKAFAITILAGDQLWDYVTLLLPGTTSTSIFNDDASTNNFPITIVGDTRPNNFNPYTPGYYSNFFDGTGDYLRTQLDAVNIRTSFTIEAWINLTTTTGLAFFSASNTAGSAGANLYLNIAGGTVYLGDGVINNINFSASVIPLNSWNHIAITFDGTTYRVFVNGTSVGSSTTLLQNNTLNGIDIGARVGENLFTNGYISNFRVVKGTALYTANFTPPTQPLTAIANTSLLTCQSNRFIDNSTNNFTITRNGNVTVNSFDPFIPSSSTATLGSTYFDGIGDVLTVPNNSAFDLAGSNFTMEAWIYPTATGNFPSIATKYQSGNASFFWTLGASASPNNANFYFYPQGGGFTLLSVSNAVVLNTWSHHAVVRTSTTLTYYINGVSVATASVGTSVMNNSTSLVSIGNGGETGYTSYPFTGYISNLRIVNGTAVYTSNFTPSTTPLTAISGTSLLTCQTNQPVENNDFLDSSTNNFLVTRNGNTTQGTFSPYAENWSNYFDGNGDYLSVAANTAFNITVNFTIEAWVYFTAIASTNADNNRVSTIAAYTNGNTANAGWEFFVDFTNNRLHMASWGTGNSAICSFTPVLNTWYHLSASKSGSTNFLFVNGVSQTLTTNSLLINNGSSPTLNIGRNQGTNTGYLHYTNGYISNLRIINGTAVYTSNFTPSTTPLQPITNTSLLTCRDSSFVDDSANRFTVTSNGNVSVQKFGPFAGTTLPTPYYGAYFDGNGDSIQVGSSNTGVTFGTADFTIEAWIYWNSLSSESAIMFGNGVGWTFYVYPANKLQWGTTSPQTPANLLTGNTTLNTGTWYHIAVTRASGTVTLWVNGMSDGTVADSANYSASGDLRVGISHSGQFFNGYMSNVRVVKGTAVYTSTFTPSTTPLTAITNTSVLTCQSATFIDNSTNNFAITAVGNSQPTFFNPFTVTYSTLQSYSPSVFGGSMYFDGAGDFLTVPSNTTLALGTSDFTIECWVYATSTPNDVGIFESRTNGISTTADGFTLTAFSSSVIRIFSNGVLISSSGTAYINTWCHVAVVRSSGIWNLYINGVSQGTNSGSRNMTNTDAVVGAGRYTTTSTPNAFFPGYISALRIVKGTALYTSNFVPSNQPLTAVQNSVLLLNGTAGGIIDVSSGNNLETVADTKLSVVQSKWSSTSMFFDGTGDMLVGNGIASSGAYDRLTVSGVVNTVECWVYLNALSSPRGCICGSWSSNVGWTYDITTGGDIFIAANGAGFTVSLSTKITTGAWLHLAFVNDGTNIKIYLNGINVGTQAVMGPSSYIGPITIGMRSDSTLPLNGYMNDFRITRAARYTANFTPPTGPFVTN